MATLGLNSSGFKTGLDSSVRNAQTAGDKIMASLGGGGKSTVHAKRNAESAGDAYGKWWGDALLKRDLEAAGRSNQARRLLRQRAEASTEASVEAASRSNLARRLWRERAEARKAGDPKISNMRSWKGLGTSILTGDLEGAAYHATKLVNSLGLLKYVLNPVTGIVLGLVAGFAAAYKLAGALTTRLTGLKWPEMHTEYVAKHLQKLHAAAEAQKEINKEVVKSIELYNSAASAAKRVEETTKAHYQHLQKMNDYREQAELNAAQTDAGKDAVRAKYAERALALKNEERNAEIKNKQAEADALVKESSAKKKQGDAIVVGSKEHDDQILNQRKKAAEEAQAYLDGLEKSKGSAKEKLVRGYNAVALTGVSGNDLDAAEKANKAEAYRRIQAHKDFVDQNAGNDEARAKKADLYKAAGESGEKAATAILEGSEMAKKAKQSALDDAEENRAKLAAENSKSGGAISMTRNSLQAIGAYGAAAPHEQQMLDTAKRSEGYLQRIEVHMASIAGKGGAPNRGVAF